MSRAFISRQEGFLSQVELDSGHEVTFDASVKSGGGGEELTPSEGISAALAACTMMTMQFYAARKSWDLAGIGVEVDTTYEGANPTAFKVTIDFPDHLTDEQRDKLRIIAHKCPVHKLLLEPVPVETV